MSYKQISPIIVAEGGTGAVTLTDHGVLLGSGTGAITPLAAASTGQTLMGSTGADPSFTGSPSFSGSVTAATGLANTTGAVTINSGTSAFDLSVDASATTVSIATGGAAKTVTLGSTNTTSSTAIKSGTGNIAMNSGLTIDSSGRWTSSVQPMFLVGENASPTNVTGDNTVYTMVWDTEVYDVGSNFASNTFTAPVTGKYLLEANVTTIYSAAYSYAFMYIQTTGRTYTTAYGPVAVGLPSNLAQAVSTLADMTAGDTAVVKIFWGNAAKTVGIQGNTGAGTYTTYFCGMLIS